MNNTIAQATADDRITALAAAALVANNVYAEARKMPNPATTLDEICDAWPEIAPQVVRTAKTTPEAAEVLKDALADCLWAYTAVEHSRAEAGDGFGYVFDLLADDLRKGADPHLTRTTALAAPGRLRELAEQADGRPATSPSPVGIMLGTTQCCARRPDRDQLNGRRLDGREDTDDTFNDRLLCTEQHDHNGDHRDALGRTWTRVPAEVVR